MKKSDENILKNTIRTNDSVYGECLVYVAENGFVITVVRSNKTFSIDEMKRILVAAVKDYYSELEKEKK